MKSQYQLQQLNISVLPKMMTSMYLPCLDNCDSSSELLSSRRLFAPCCDAEPDSSLLFILAKTEEGQPQ